MNSTDIIARKILEWLESLPTPVRDDIATNIVILAVIFPDKFTSPWEMLSVWVKEPIDFKPKIGRLVLARALIDFLVMDRSSEAFSQRARDQALANVDDGRFPTPVRKLFNENIPILENYLTDWQTVALSWSEVNEKISDSILAIWQSAQPRAPKNGEDQD
jgi:hypothetical protein